MGTLAAALAAFFSVHTPAGHSVYSFEPVAACGLDPAAPTCELRPVCDEAGPLCAPPRWSGVRGAWVRVESTDTARARYGAISEALVSTARRLVACELPDGSVDFECKPIHWGGGKGQVRELAMTAAAVAIHESGLREDVEIGAPPLGRGPAGEVCLIQAMPDQIAANASWLSPEERKAAATPAGREAVARQLLGSDPVALSRCFEVGMRMLAKARSQCRVGDAGTFAAYGTGGRCGAASEAWALDRARTLAALRASVLSPRVAVARPKRIGRAQ